MNAHQSVAPAFAYIKSDVSRVTTSSKVVVELFGTNRCHGTQFCKIALETRDVDYVFRNLDIDVQATRKLQAYYAPSSVNFPTVMIGGLLLNNPSLSELDRALERQTVKRPQLYHCAEQMRYLMYLPEGEAFIAYRDGDGIRCLDHTFVPSKFRNSGVGKQLAMETLKRLCRDKQKTQISCAFIERVARCMRDEAVALLKNSIPRNISQTVRPKSILEPILAQECI